MTIYSQKISISGREFTQEEIDNVVETVEIFSNLTRTELANTICVHLDWFTASMDWLGRRTPQ